MGKKDKNPILDDYERMRNEIIRDRVNDVFRHHPKDYISKMEEIGFEYFDDDVDYEEIDNPNYPLIRKYYKEANKNLKSLLLYGLDNFPGRIDLLSDLAYLHEFEHILGILITYYTQACIDQENLETFSGLVKNFYYSINPDGYEAYYALRELFEPGTDKRRIIDFLIAEDEEAERKASAPAEF